jgi:hypothetical protein
VLAISSPVQLFWRALFVNPRNRRVFVSSILLLIFRFDLCGLEPERSVSPSGQFIIYGVDAAYRGAISALAEKTRANLLAVLKRRDNWKIPIVINLQPRAANLPEIPATDVGLSQTEMGLKLQLDLTISREINPTAIEHELVRVVLLEMIYRNRARIVSGDAYVDPPTWLVAGLLQSAPNRDHAPLEAVLSLPAHPSSLEEFLRQRPESLDSAARELYGAYSFVLLQLLAESPDGHAQLGRYIDNLALASTDPLGDLHAAFPAIRDFEKTWRSTISSMKSAEQGLLTFSHTQAKLNETLSKSLRLDEFMRIKSTPAQRLALRKLAEELCLLTAHANPVLRPVIQDYQHIAEQLALGRHRGVATRLAELKRLREKLSARMSDVDDYMNWFEAAKLETSSGLFDDSLKTGVGSESQKPRRRDALSIYLDAMELEF